MINTIFLLLIIVFSKAVFSAAETALVYVNHAEIKQLSKTDKKAEKIKYFMEDAHKFFGTIEVGIITCEFLASTIVSITFLETLINFLTSKNISLEISATISIIIITIILSYIMLVFGNLLPKRIARNYPKKTIYTLITMLCIITKINYPFERLIDISTKLFSKLFNLKEELQEKMTDKQLKMIISEAKEEGILQNIEKKIFDNTIKANNVSVQKIMVPLEKTGMIDINEEFSEIVSKIKEYKYTRIPVYEENRINIIGIFYIKDIMLNYLQTGIKNKKQLKELLRKPNYIYKGEKLFSAFKNIQKENKMFAIVTDEISKPIGIVTIEDILETLVGKISDEDDV